MELFSAEGGPVILQTLQAGDALGWSWLIAPYHWRFDARAVECTEAIALEGKSLRNKMEEERDLGFELTKRLVGVITQRLESARLQLLSHYGAHS